MFQQVQEIWNKCFRCSQWKNSKVCVDYSTLSYFQGETLVDLGSGDGQVVIEAARRGIKAVGYELNPVYKILSIFLTSRLVWSSRYAARRAGVSNNVKFVSAMVLLLIESIVEISLRWT